MIEAYSHTLQKWGHHSNGSERLNVQDKRELDEVVVVIVRIPTRRCSPECMASRMRGFSTIVCPAYNYRPLTKEIPQVYICKHSGEIPQVYMQK